MPLDVAPLVYALVAALLFALGDQCQYLGVRTLDSRSGTMISIVTSTACFWLLAPFLLDWTYLGAAGIWIFALIGLFRPALSANLSVAGVRYLGPTLSSTLSSTSPLFGTALGVLWLGELLTWPVAVGTAGIIGSIVLLSRRGKTGSVNDWPLWALGFPIAAAAIRSLAHVLSKVGMVTVPDAYVAGLVSFSVSSVLLLSMQAARRERPQIVLGSPSLWFVGSGVAMALAITALNQALLTGQIIVVVPIVSAAPVFTLLLSIAVFRRERPTARLVAAVAVVVPSVILIALGR
ncbi:EamA family transporter [Thalassobaculum sp.]|uniref:EamA family transporter n=1 Tax=Thalassobaculum sp. TaxID=2022740 RepID=UPI0032EB1F84